MEYTREGRKIPLLASLISLVYGVGSVLALLTALQIYHPSHVVQQPFDVRVVYIIAEIFLLVGAVFLWRMKAIAWKLFLASLLCSIYTTLRFQSISSAVPRHPLFNGLLLALFAAICVYVWRVTSRWQAEDLNRRTA